MEKRENSTAPSAAEWIPDPPTLPRLREAAKNCRGCPLWENATRIVFGEGKTKARWLFVGEQPGDQEDRQGRPFVGPAGQLLNRALADAGIARADCYLTNAVKHFKWKPRGKRRIHQKPSGREVAACRPWLEAELAAIHPDAVICLGATAAQALLGPKVRVLRDRGVAFSSPGAPKVWVTIHPSMLLRMPDRAKANEEYGRFVEDIRLATRD